MIEEGAMWLIFIVLVASLLILDLFVLNRKSRAMSMKRAAALSAFWISVGSAFGLFIFFATGDADLTVKYYAGYVIEEMMSIDNLFVFIIIFAYFRVPDEYQHKALFFGIVGALTFRILFILAGIELLNRFDIMIYIFGAVLIFTAVKTVMKRENGKASAEENFFVRLCRRFMKVSDEYDGDRLFTRKDGIRIATPLLLTVIVLEMTDIIFAFDSIPAVLAITTDTFIVYSSNVFAILGLRSIYFVLRNALSRLAYLKYGLGAILAFVGMKMLLSDVYHIDVIVSLAVILAIIAVTVLLSVTLSKERTEKSV